MPSVPLSNRIAMGIARPACSLWLTLFYRLRVEGMENIPCDGPVILIANHQSYFDPIIIGILVKPRLFRAIARSGLFRFRPLGWFIGLFGAIPIDQSKSDISAMKLAIDEVNLGKALVIYPEGERSRTGVTSVFMRGFLLVLKRTEAPVVPIVIEGAYDIWPSRARFPRLRGRLAVRALPPIPHDELMEQDQGVVLDHLRQIIETERMSLRSGLRQESGGRYPCERDGDIAYWEADGESASGDG